MTKRISCVSILLCLVSFAAIALTPAAPKKHRAAVSATYSNPVIRYGAPDPTAMRMPDGAYYLYATEDIRNVPVFKSTDLVNWERVGICFTEETRPDFEPGYAENIHNIHAHIWAPEIRVIKGKYVLFYSLAEWGNHWVSTVGYAVADKPEGPFTPKGKVFNSRDVDVENSIDQFFWEENGKYYMTWGSFRGIYLMELNVTDDLVITPKLETKVKIAGGAYEASNIWKRGDYYYLICSIGSCCEGVKSTYKTVVGRSKNLAGPYVNRDGERMLDNKHEIMLGGDTTFAGTGHNSFLVEDDNHETWMLYHAFELARPDFPRQVLLDKVLWDNEGWPYIQSKVASTKAPVPFIKNKDSKNHKKSNKRR